MITIKNTTTGETINVSNTNVRDGKIIGRYEFGKRYYNKYTMLTRIGSEDEQPILQLAEGWEIITSERAPRAQRQSTPAPQPSNEETPTEPTPAPTPAPAPQTTPTQSAVVNAFAALTPLFAGVEANVTANIMAKVQPLIDRVPQTVTHVIKTREGERQLPAGEVLHANFDRVCRAISEGQWIYLYGPTGSGKNVLAEQVAKALGLKFYYQAHVADRFELTGFIDANGNYQPTEFYKAYTEGGLFMLDELDASDENALVTLNSAYNGYFAFPNGTQKQHPNFRVIAAGNTCGRGGTEDYTGRHSLDVSSLCRFRPVFHNYCNEIDMAAANGDEALVAFIHALRKAKGQAQIIASPRQIKEIVRDSESKEALVATLQDLFATYLTEDELEIIKNVIADKIPTDNIYRQAFLKIKAINY